MSRTIKKPYPKRNKGKAIDRSCRNNGKCSWCSENRKHFDTIERIKAEEKIKEFWVEQN